MESSELLNIEYRMKNDERRIEYLHLIIDNTRNSLLFLMIGSKFSVVNYERSFS